MQEDAALGEKIKSRRLELGLSQTDVGQPLGLSFQQIQKYERGINRVAAGRLTAIAAVLQVTPSFFYAKQDSRDPVSRIKLDAESKRVVKAFARIRSRKVRHQIVLLAEKLADDSN